MEKPQNDSELTAMPVVTSLDKFDRSSGNILERLVFNHRGWFMLVCLVITAGLGYQLRLLHVNASFEKMLPQSHPFVRNYFNNRAELRGLGDTVRIAVENTQGNIYNKDYLEVLEKANQKVFLTSVVDRAWMKSLWSPAVLWSAVSEEGFVGGPVMPPSYDGSEKSIAELRANVESANLVGNLVSNDLHSSMIVVPLLATDADTGRPVDYGKFSKTLEEVRTMVEKDPRYRVHVIGFAKLVGDLIDGLEKVMSFFALAAATAAIVIYLYTRCLRSTILVLACSLVAVTWQLGIVASMGGVIDPFSVLVPFLVFAIGVSHASQKMNGIMQDIGRGTHRWVAARYTFRRLFMAGLTALLADAVGFAVLMVIDIPIIRELAMAASIGVGVLIFTNLLLLPVLLSYVGVSQNAATRSLGTSKGGESSSDVKLGIVQRTLGRFTERRFALGAIGVAVVLALASFIKSHDLKIGDLDPGAPELRADSRYNKDNNFITTHFDTSSDVFAIMVKSQSDGCRSNANMNEIDRLEWRLEQVPGVLRTNSLVDSVRQFTTGAYEGNPKMATVPRSQLVLRDKVNLIQSWNTDLTNNECTLMPVLAYLSDHRAETLERVVKVASVFAAEHNNADRQFLLAAGNSGIDAATNEVVKSSNRTMLLYVYGAVILLCAITFRSWRAVVVAVLPLMLTSIMAEALMSMLGIGVKVATLPVIALGVGIGVDYALYLLSVQLAFQRKGESLHDAYQHALGFTGKVVALVGVTLAAGVVTWAWSPIKFQADMGIMLTFMFLWNMIGALVLIPALSHFLLQRAK
ncbi:MAG: MMPL family transporter [Georgfuchsia sp.]